MRPKVQLLIALLLLPLCDHPAKVVRKAGATELIADAGNRAHFAPLHRGISELTQQAKTRILDSYGNLPLRFEQNQGQFDQSVKFLSRGSGYSLFLTGGEAVLSLSKRQQSGVDQRGLPEPKKEKSGAGAVTLRIGLVGGNPAPSVVGTEELAGKSNYFIGNDPHNWRTNVPNYAKVKYEDVYPGIDLVYYGNQGQLEFDFIVAAAVSPSSIGLRFGGADKVEVDAGGDLIVQAEGVQVRLKKPVAYQETEEGRNEVACAFSTAGDSRVGFKLGAYDSARPLVIDPTLLYSTYLGGSGEDAGYSIAVDSSGSAYITGYASSTNFPSANAMQAGYRGGTYDALVTKLNPAGSALAYSSYLGGSGYDIGWGIAVDSSGSAYVTGQTDSSNFPTANALQTGSGGNHDAFVTKLSPSGSALIFSTYLGGNSGEIARGIAVDSSGNAYVTGYTYSSNFPTLNAVQAGLGANAAIFASIDNLLPSLQSTPAGYDLPAGTHLVVDGANQLRGMTVFENGKDSIATTKAIVPELPASEAAASSRTLFAPFISLSRPSSQTKLERFDTILNLYNGDSTQDASLTVQALSPTGQPLFSNGSEKQLVLKAGQQLTIPVLKRGAADGLFTDDPALTGQDPRNGYLKIVLTRQVTPFGFVGSVNVHGFVALKFAGANETVIPLESNGTPQAYYLHVAHNPGQGPYRMALVLLNPTDIATPVKVEVFETNAGSTPEERARLGRPSYVGRIELGGHEQLIKFLDQLVNEASVVAGQPKPPMTSQLGGYIRLTSENPAVPLLTFCTYFVVEDGAGFVVKSLSSIEGQRPSDQMTSGRLAEVAPAAWPVAFTR